MFLTNPSLLFSRKLLRGIVNTRVHRLFEVTVDPPSCFQMLSLAPNSLGHIVPAHSPATRQPLEGGVTHWSRRKTVRFEPFLIPGVRRKHCKTDFDTIQEGFGFSSLFVGSCFSPPSSLSGPSLSAGFCFWCSSVSFIPFPPLLAGDLSRTNENKRWKFYLVSTARSWWSHRLDGVVDVVVDVYNV